MSSDEAKRIRNVMLDGGTGDSARRSCEMDVYIGGDGDDEDPEEVTVEVQQLAIGEAQMAQVSIPEPVKAKVREVVGDDAEVDHQLYLVSQCTYVPGSDAKPLDSPEAVARLHEAPFHTDSWVSRLSQAVNFVHGYRTETPDGVQDPRLIEIADAAEQLQAICQEESELDSAKVGKVAQYIAEWARYMDQGGDAEGKPTTHSPI